MDGDALDIFNPRWNGYKVGTEKDEVTETLHVLRERHGPRAYKKCSMRTTSASTTFGRQSNRSHRYLPCRRQAVCMLGPSLEPEGLAAIAWGVDASSDLIDDRSGLVEHANCVFGASSTPNSRHLFRGVNRVVGSDARYAIVSFR